jgi:hypothetical protein
MPQTVDLTQDTDNPAFLLHYRDQIQSRISRLYYSLQYLVRSLALAINPHFCCAHNALLALSTRRIIPFTAHPYPINIVQYDI